MKNEIKGGDSHGLSTDINVITAEIKVDLQGISDAIFRVGERLLHVRKYEMEKQKGGWDAYCTKELGISRKHANRFVRVYERFGSGTPVSQEITRLPLSLLDSLIEFDDGELEKPRELPDGTTKTLTEMSRREIEEFKRREREAIAEKEKAVAAAQEADRRAKQSEAQAAMAQRSEEIMRARLDAAEEREPDRQQHAYKSVVMRFTITIHRATTVLILVRRERPCVTFPPIQLELHVVTLAVIFFEVPRKPIANRRPK
ncbi:hypothetical protein [Sporosarcina obsidiansis]|uniref:hypothetical protein n=1 Tax=Sporosarcina obsidiansis TaxID=2660748 RepID=UPI00129A1EBE|nr:hypothetical protein [Sporosarcina obsidiansis]